jgi:glucosyl-3-phosphoglycerate phosphatase
VTEPRLPVAAVLDEPAHRGMAWTVTVNEVILVRHGESLGNVASAAADRDRAEAMDLDVRDADVELSDLCRSQARAVGHWLAGLSADRWPTAVLSSPYLRARQTATLALESAGTALPMTTDERLRDRELGILDRLTARGVAARHPDEADRREHLGKFYYRPPGGESWTDVVLRLRSVLAELDTLPAGRLLITTHDAVILLVRYVLEGLTEEQLMDIARHESVRNAAITRVVRDGPSAPWRTVVFNDVEHLADAGIPPTAHPGERHAHS